MPGHVERNQPCRPVRRFVERGLSSLAEGPVPGRRDRARGQSSSGSRLAPRGGFTVVVGSLRCRRRSLDRFGTGLRVPIATPSRWVVNDPLRQREDSQYVLRYEVDISKGGSRG
jgi:hypothetical protein